MTAGEKQCSDWLSDYRHGKKQAKSLLTDTLPDLSPQRKRVTYCKRGRVAGRLCNRAEGSAGNRDLLLFSPLSRRPAAGQGIERSDLLVMVMVMVMVMK